MAQALSSHKFRPGRQVALIPVLLAGLAVAGFAAPAQAGYEVCNQTSYVLEAAVGQSSSGGIATKGWIEILPGACKTAIKGELDLTPVYLYARTPKLYDHVLKQFSGGKTLCVGNGDFDLKNAADCSSPEHSKAKFIEITPRKADWRTSLEEDKSYKTDAAAMAGVQRLLAMSGYDVGEVDGLAGNMTNRALDDFMSKSGLQDAAKTSPQVLQALISNVRRRQTESGLRICNETRHLVWTTIGLHQGENIVTRGWYKIAAGECIRPWRKPLDGQVIYSFGEAVDKNGPVIAKGSIPLIWDGPVELCTNDARFAIESQGNCRDRGLKITKFRKIDLGGAKTWTIRYTEPQ